MLFCAVLCVVLLYVRQAGCFWAGWLNEFNSIQSVHGVLHTIVSIERELLMSPTTVDVSIHSHLLKKTLRLAWLAATALLTRERSLQLYRKTQKWIVKISLD